MSKEILERELAAINDAIVIVSGEIQDDYEHPFVAVWRGLRASLNIALDSELYEMHAEASSRYAQTYLNILKAQKRNLEKELQDEKLY